MDEIILYDIIRGKLEEHNYASLQATGIYEPIKNTDRLARKIAKAIIDKNS